LKTGKEICHESLENDSSAPYGFGSERLQPLEGRRELRLGGFDNEPGTGCSAGTRNRSGASAQGSTCAAAIVAHRRDTENRCGRNTGRPQRARHGSRWQ
jgi:hypothetical protein